MATKSEVRNSDSGSRATTRTTSTSSSMGLQLPWTGTSRQPPSSRKQTSATVFRGYQVDEVDQFLKGCLSATHDGVRAVADPSTISAPPQRSKRAVKREFRETVREQKNAGGRVERESRQERLARVLHPGEEIIAQTTCQEGLWPSDSGTSCVVAVTNERLLTFGETCFLSTNSGELLEEMDLDKVRSRRIEDHVRSARHTHCADSTGV